MKKLLIAFAFIFSAHSNAGVLIEPYLGFAIAGSGDVTYANQYDVDYSALTYGGRLGYSFLGLMFGVDYSLSTFDLESERTNFSAKDEMSRTDLGIFVGYELPIMFRVWGKYILDSELEGQDSVVATNQLYDSRDVLEEGSGYALGIGWTGLPFLSVNFEYRTVEYDKNKLDGVAVSNYNEKLDLSDFLLSVSLPIDL